MSSDTAAVREGEHLDWQKLEAWLKANVEGLAGEMKVTQFHGGHANLTYCVAFGDSELVVRRPPFGEIAPGAHDMKREYRALAALAPVFDRAPRVYGFCEDESVIGAPFIVMERRSGVIVRADIPREFADLENIEQRVSFALVDAMADLHAIDPDAAGLGDLGRPLGFVTRQLEGWYGRWKRVVEKEDPVFERAYQLLKQHQPQTQRHTLVHNDLKLDNCMFDVENPDRVATILDWDMTTLGDPLIELGTLLSYWQQSGDDFDRSPTIDLDMKGFPSRQSLVRRYAESGANVEGIDWYEAFGLWKQAVVLQQLYRRFEVGETTDERFRSFPEKIPGMLTGVVSMMNANRSSQAGSGDTPN